MSVGRVVVVSENLRTGISLMEHHDVEALRPDELAGWLTSGSTQRQDVVVLELLTPEATHGAVTALRGQARMEPVLAIATDDAGWDAPAARDLPATVVLAAPLGPRTLLDAVTAVVRHGLAGLEPGAVPATRPAPALAQDAQHLRDAVHRLKHRHDDPVTPVPPVARDTDGPGART